MVFKVLLYWLYTISLKKSEKNWSELLKKLNRKQFSLFQTGHYHVIYKKTFYLHPSISDSIECRDLLRILVNER